MINIAGKNKAKILAALYNNSLPANHGHFEFMSENMTENEAQEILDKGFVYINYLKGRIIKTEFSTNQLDPLGYDTYNGEGTMAQVIEEIKE